MPTPMRVPIAQHIKQLRVEHIKPVGQWRIWLMANGDFTLGTFLELGPDGTLLRITWHEDGTETVLEITDDNTTDT